MTTFLATATLSVASLLGQAPPHHHACRRFSVARTEATARRTYAGTRRVSLRELRRLGWMEACQVQPHDHGLVRTYDRHQAWLWEQRRQPPMFQALASWYDDAGSTACGFHASLGVANRTLPCGTHVTLCYATCVTATVQDRGPFISGRDFDLNATLKSALGCPDLCDLRASQLG